MNRGFNILCVVLLFVWSCTDDTTELNNEDLLFSDSKHILIPPFSYSDGSSEYQSIGDTMYYTHQTDTFPDEPLFQWDSLGFRYVTVAVFNQRPVTSSSQISNIESIIWQWHSGMEFGKEGKVMFLEGKQVNDGVIRYEELPDNLEIGHYYWAVWGWDNAAREIIYSSRIMEFYVSE
jgi:hypothetical protein